MTALKGIIRLHRWMLDEKRRSLADLQVFVEKLRDDLSQLDRDLETERQAAEADQEVGVAYSTYVAAALDRREKLCGTIGDLEQQVEKARQEVSDAFEELKKFEIARDNAENLDALERNKRERLNLDEAGLSIYRRNKASSE